MDYLLERCLSQAIMLAEVTRRELKLILKELVSLYACDDKKFQSIISLVDNAVFKELKSSQSIKLHLNYINSFCPNEDEFGKKRDEAKVLKLKKGVLDGLDNLMQSTPQAKDFIEGIAERYTENNNLIITYALLLYFNNAKDSVYLPLLRKAEGKGKVEAGLILLNFETEENKQYFFNKLCNNKELSVRPGVLKEIADFHKMSTKEI